jgi:hypothetical protein
MVALAVLKGIKKLGQKIMDGINNLVANGRGEDEQINKITKKTGFWIIIGVVIYWIFTGIISSMVAPVDEKKLGYAGEYSYNIYQDFKIPTCLPDAFYINGPNNRLILREIALSIFQRVRYSHFSEWWIIGAHPKWNTAVQPKHKWINVKGKDGKYIIGRDGKPIKELDKDYEEEIKLYPLYGLDCGHFASWVWLQCTGFDRWPLSAGNVYAWLDGAKEGRFGVEEVHLEKIEDLKIGDVFVRTEAESPACKKIDKKTGKEVKNGCNHVAIYIGEGQIAEEVDGMGPRITEINSKCFDCVLEGICVGQCLVTHEFNHNKKKEENRLDFLCEFYRKCTSRMLEIKLNSELLND